MNSGRELDRLVAEKVMGLKRGYISSADGSSSEALAKIKGDM